MNVSIIVPVYNCERYVAQAIESALLQDCEVIVVNDGSTDGTKAIIESYSDKIRAIHQSNGGTAKALNAGIRASSNDWIKWLSADDVLNPGAVRYLVAEAEKTPDCNNRIFYTHYDIIDEHGKYLKTFTEPDNSANSKAVLLNKFYGNGSTSLIHKDVFAKCGLFDETVGYKEDYEFWLRAVLVYDVRLTLVDFISLSYRVHPGQLTEQKRIGSVQKSQDIREKILAQAPQYRSLLIRTPLKLRARRWLRQQIRG